MTTHSLKTSRSIKSITALLIAILFQPGLSAQTISEVLDKSIQTIRQMTEAHYTVDQVSTNPLNGDTIKTQKECWLKRSPQDTITGIYYYFSNSNSGFSKYNGIDYYSYYPDYYNFILKYSLKDHPEKFRSVKFSYGIAPSPVTSNLYGTLFNQVDYMSQILTSVNSEKDSSRVKNSSPPDTLIEGIPCYNITISNEDKLVGNVCIILIDKKSCLPLEIVTSIHGSAVINEQKVLLDQYSKVRYSNIQTTLENFDYMLSDKSLPEGVDILNEMPEKKVPQKGDTAPSWKHPELNTGKLICSDSLRGNVVVVDFTSTWCIHCIEGSMVMKELYQKYNGRYHLIFINMFSCSTDDQEKVRKYASSHPLEGMVLYKAKESEKPYGIWGYPDFFIIDPQGKIALSYPGYGSDLKEQLSIAIDNCLSELHKNQ